MTRSLLLAPLTLVALAGCGSSDDAVSIDGAWARTSAVGQTTGAVYFELTVDADDRLIGVSVPAGVAADAQVHEVVMADDGSMDDGSMDDHEMEGEMRMQELTDGLALSAGDTVVFEPGSYHVMLVDLAALLETGDEIELTFDFETADDVTVTVPVAETAP